MSNQPIPATMTRQCKRCEGLMFKSVALIDDSVEMGIPDFPGNHANSRGQTVTLKSDGKLYDCMKCFACGWSISISEMGKRENAG